VIFLLCVTGMFSPSYIWDAFLFLHFDYSFLVLTGMIYPFLFLRNFLFSVSKLLSQTFTYIVYALFCLLGFFLSTVCTYFFSPLINKNTFSSSLPHTVPRKLYHPYTCVAFSSLCRDFLSLLYTKHTFPSSYDT
jgi:hypothetical protein